MLVHGLSMLRSLLVFDWQRERLYCLEHGSPNFFVRGPHKAITQLFGGGYVMWMFQDMLHSTKSTNFSKIYYFYIIVKMSWRQD